MRYCHAHLHHQTYKQSLHLRTESDTLILKHFASDQVNRSVLSDSLHTLLYRLFTESCLSLELKPSIH